MTRPLRYPLVLGLARGASGHEHELVLRRDGAVEARCLGTGRVVGGLSLHEAADWLRDRGEASA